MFELSKNRYDILFESVLKIPFNVLLARSVLCDHVDGRVFVDSCEKPRSGYIVHPYGRAFLFGDSANEAFCKDLLDYFAGVSHERKKTESLQAFPDGWDIFLDRLLARGLAARHSRVNFTFSAEKFHETYGGNSRCEVIETPVEMLFALQGSVTPKEYWKTPEQCAGMAKAYSVMIGGKPVSTAFAVARHDDTLEIGIETLKEYHGQGLAFLACATLIEYCLANTLEPVWSCRYENTASMNLAKKLGFTEPLRTPYYSIPLN